MKARHVGLAATTFSLIVLASCGDGSSKASRPKPPPRATPSSTTSSIYSSPTTSAPVPITSPPGPTTSTTAPVGFQAESVTFVSTQLGWVLGTDSCSPAPSCAPVLLRTEDAGRSWIRIPAPAQAGIDQVRFADSEDGWIWASYNSGGSGLWSTHDGGLQWTGQQFPRFTSGYQVSDVEAAGGVVRAAVADFDQGLVALEASPVGKDDWVPSPTTLPIGAGPVPSSQIVLQGTSGWVVELDRGVVGGARLEDGAWVPWVPPCDGAPLSLTASDRLHLVAVCEEGVYGPPPALVRIFFSSDGGSTFQVSPTTLPSVIFGLGASPAPGVAVVAESGGNLVASFDGYATWSPVYPESDGRDWTYVGFTTPRQGVAIDGNGVFFMTFDGGHTWTAVHLPNA